MGGGEVVKKGYLVKSPPLDGKMKNWHKRFFCLFTSKILEYYKVEGGEMKGLINLEDCTSVNSGLSHKKYQHVFNIETAERKYYLVASTKEEMMDWVETLCKVCEFISADDEEEDEVPPPVNPRSLSLAPSQPAANLPPVPGISKSRSGSLHTGRGLPPTPLQESLYSLAGQDTTQTSQQKSATMSGVSLSDYFSQSGQTKKPDGDGQSSSTSNGAPPPGIPLHEALSMKGYSSQGQQVTVGPAVPPRTPLSDALQMKGFSQMPVSEGDSASSTTSIAMEAEREVRRMLKQQSFGDIQVKPGTPLNEALAQKGIASMPQSQGNSRASIDSFAIASNLAGPRSVSEEPIMESHYSSPPNNRLAYPQGNEQEFHYQSPRSSLLESGHYQSPRALSVDDPEQTYNVPPPPRPAPIPRSSSTKRSLLLNQGSSSEISQPTNGGVVAPPINRSAKPRPPDIDRRTKPPSKNNSDNELPQSTQNTVHYVSLQKLRVTNEPPKPVPRPRSTQRSDYTQVSLEDTLEMQKRMKERNQPPQLPPPRSNVTAETFSSEDDGDSSDSEVSYTKMRRFTFEEADKPSTYYQSPRSVMQEEEDFDDPTRSFPTGR